MHGGTGAAGIVVYGTFNMYGGRVENNQSKMMGGGINLPPWQTEATAVLNVYGGTFRNNYATTAGDDMTIENENAHTVKLPTGKSMTATGKMKPFRATGWFEDGRQGTRYDANTHAEEATKLDYQQEPWQADLKVVYKEAYTITYVLNDGSFEEGYEAPSSYEAGDTTQLPTADKLSRNGYRFEGWYDNPNFEGAPITEIGPEMRGDLVFYAKWSKNPTPNPDPDPKPDPEPKPNPEPKPDSKPIPVPKPESKPNKMTPSEKAKSPKAPKTGDETTLLLSGATVFACGVGAIVLEKKKKWAIKHLNCTGWRYAKLRKNALRVILEIGIYSCIKLILEISFLIHLC